MTILLFPTPRNALIIRHFTKEQHEPQYYFGMCPFQDHNQVRQIGTYTCMYDPIADYFSCRFCDACGNGDKLADKLATLTDNIA